MNIFFGILFGDFRLESFVWNLPLKNSGFVFTAWELSLNYFRLGSLVWEPSPDHFTLNAALGAERRSRGDLGAAVFLRSGDRDAGAGHVPVLGPRARALPPLHPPRVLGRLPGGHAPAVRGLDPRPPKWEAVEACVDALERLQEFLHHLWTL